MILIQVVLLAALGEQAARPAIVQSVDVSVPFAPVTFTQEGRTQLAYELHLVNFQAADVVLTALRIEGAGAVLAEYRDDDLHRRIVRPGLRHDHPAPQVIGAGMHAVVNLWIPLPDAFSAAAVTHRLDVAVRRASGAVSTTITNTVPLPRLQPPLTLGPPLGVGRWVAVYDPLLKGGHRTAIYTLDGRARIPARFAIDFIAMPREGTWTRNPDPRPPDWNGFGADVLAVADGVVAVAVDDSADDMPRPVPPEAASGNHVALDLGGGRFAFYEHLRQGSVRVKAGQTVRRGQLIAQLGSSGSTSLGPHLHFHVADVDSLLGAEGLPFGFSQFTVFGAFDSLDGLARGEPWRPAAEARSEFNTRPAPNSVISFR
jgi:hypothetical protein